MGKEIMIRDLTFSYGGNGNQLEHISLDIAAGEVIVMTGPSGSGKSSLTRVINGLIPYFYEGELSGEVFVDGKPLKKIPSWERGKIAGNVFQDPRSQFFANEVAGEIAFGCENYGYSHEDIQSHVHRAAADIKIQDILDHSLHSLSYGMRQKVAIASAEAIDPEIYVMDEPSANLDIASTYRFADIIRDLKQQGKTIIIAEHRLYYLMDLADRIVYLEKGRITGIYTPDEFRQIPDETRKQMGLRALDLTKEVPVCPQDTDSAKKEKLVLELREVSVFRKKQPVLSEISFAAARGEVIAVVGHNGAGKTTFSRALCGLHRECGGTFFWEGEPQNAKKRLSLSYMVMQDVNYELFAESVEAECSFGIKNPDPALVEHTMQKLGIAPLKKRHPNTLSGGQKQRVAVAVSMICKKELLVFDEPTSGLDYDSMVQVAGLFGALRAAGKLVFVVTHDYEFACRICTRVLHLDQGKLLDDLAVEPGNLEKIKEIFSVTEKKKRGE